MSHNLYAFNTTLNVENMPDFIYHVRPSKNILSNTLEQGDIEKFLDNMEVALRQFRPDIFTERMQNS